MNYIGFETKPQQKTQGHFDFAILEQESPSKAELPETYSNIRFLDHRLNDAASTWSKAPYGYQWPASQLSRFEMAKLTVVSRKLKRPLNQLIKEAVDRYADALLIELGLAKASSIEDTFPNLDSFGD